MSDWFCRLDGQFVGPIDALTLKRWGETGRIQPEDEVARAADGPWSPASHVNGLQFRASAPVPIAVAPATAAHRSVNYAYKMTQFAPSLLVAAANERGTEAAEHLQALVNSNAVDGWEFFRVDEFGIASEPGCFGAIFGEKTKYKTYYVATFRKPAENA